MRIAVVTLFPEMLDAVLSVGVTGRAVARGLLEVARISPREHALDRHRTVDDRPYGGGPGMVMQAAPLVAALADARARAAPGATTIYLSPQGRRLDQERVRALAQSAGFVLLCGRYEGVDERLIER